jgi:hypothetical protein
MPPKTANAPPFQLSAEQLALRDARKRLKENKAQSTVPDSAQGQQSMILQREWLESGTAETEGLNQISIMTWNVRNRS